MGRYLLVVCLLVLVAGCNAVDFGGGRKSPASVESVTPVPVSAVNETTAPPRFSGPTPPGIKSDGAVDIYRLVDAHVELLSARSYSWAAFNNVTVSGSNITGKTFMRTVRVEDGRYVARQTEPDNTSVTTLFVENGTGYYRLSTENETDYIDRSPPEHDRLAFGPRAAMRFLADDNPTVSTVERDGRTLYQLHVSTPPANVARGDTTAGEVREYSATAYVTTDGLIRTLIVDYERVDDERVVSRRLRFDYSSVGNTTVEKPAWVRTGSTATSTPTATSDS